MEHKSTISSFVVSNTDELLAALDGVAKLRAEDVHRPVRIRLRGGIYPLTEPLTLNEAHTALCLEPYNDEKVTLSGGKRVTGWQPDTLNGHPCLSAFLPEIRDGSANYSDFYVNGHRADNTRFPEEGWLCPTAFDNPPEDKSLCQPGNWLEFAPDELKGLTFAEGTFMSLYHLWIDEHSEVASVDLTTGRIVMKYPFLFMIGEPICCLENLPCGFTRPGQWYQDRSAGKIYYWPADESITADTIEAYVPLTFEIAQINGSGHGDGQEACNIRFKDLTFAYTRGDRTDPAHTADSQAVSGGTGAITFSSARGCSVENCEFFCYGFYGAYVGSGCHDIRFDYSLFRDGGAGGVRINGGNPEMPEETYTSHVSVSDCTIDHCDRRYASGVGVLIMHASSCEVIHCNIHDLYYSGISAGWTWGYKPVVTSYTRIIGNHIWDIGQARLSDMGGVYLLGKQEGTIVAHNRIHDVFAREYGGWALYTDEGSARITMEDNICYRTFDYVYHQHYGICNTIRNNIFAYGQQGVSRITRPEEHLSLIFENNIFLGNGVPSFVGTDQHFEEQRVILRDCILWDEQGEPYGSSADPYSVTHVPGYTYREYPLADMMERGIVERPIVMKPDFADPHADDFTLPPDSPVYETGFRPIDLSDVGPRPR